MHFSQSKNARLLNLGFIKGLVKYDDPYPVMVTMILGPLHFLINELPEKSPFICNLRQTKDG